MNKINKDKFIELFFRLTSRKLWLAIAATVTAYQLAAGDGVFTIWEIMAIMSPMLAYIGVEGWADANRAPEEPKE